MKKNLLACLLSLCLVIGMVSALGFSASAIEIDPIEMLSNLTQTQMYGLIAIVAVLLIVLIVCIAASASKKKKKKAAKAAQESKSNVEKPKADAVAEAPVKEVVTETVEKEAPTREVVADVAEEAPVEEPVAEIVEEIPEEAEEEASAEPTVSAEPPKEKPDRVVIAETDANGNVIYSAYKKSFTARVIQSPIEVQERYETLKNALLSYKKVTSRVSWSYDSFKSGHKQLAKFAIRGKSLCLFLSLDMSTLEGSKYNVDDASDSKKYADVPCRLRLSSKRSIKWGLELIEKLAEQEQLVPNPKFTPKKWCMENETTESLIEKGLIKKII